MRRTTAGALWLGVAVLGLLAGCGGARLAEDRGVPASADRPSNAGAAAESERVELPANPTLDGYLAYAEQSNAGLRAARGRWEAALEAARQAGALPDPRLSFSEYVESVETRVGPQRWAATVSQTFPWFGKRSLRARAARHSAEAAGHEYEGARRKLAYEVTQAYSEYYYLARALDVTRQNVRLLEEFEEVALTRFKSGEAPRAAVIRSQVELAMLRDSLRELEARRQPAIARLNAALDRPADAPLPWPTDVPDVQPMPAEASLRTMLVESSPELRSLDAMVAKAAAVVPLVGKDQYPDITLGLTYIETGDARMPSVADSGKDPVIAMLSINVPLWRGKYAAARREARAQLEAAVAARRQKENELLTHLATAVYALDDAERKIVLCRDTLVPQARQGVEVTKQAFAAGTADYLQLIDAQRTLLDVELLWERARVNRAQRVAEIEMLVGRDLSSGDADEVVGNPRSRNGVE